MGREYVDELVLKYGGKVSTAVSGKTDFCLTGEGETQNGLPVTEGKKYKEAKEKGVKM